MDVLIVDDNEIERAGREVVLVRRGHRVVAVDWRQARTERFDASVVLAVVRRDPTAFDRWGRLRRSGPLQRLGAEDARRIVLTPDPAALDPIAELRLRRSGAAAVVASGAMTSGDRLDELVHETRFDLLPLRLDGGRIEIGPKCDPEAVVAHVLAKAEVDDAYFRAFEPGTTQHGSGLTRRRAHTLRRKISALGDLSALPTSAGGPVRDLSLPRWSDMVDFVNRCRGWHVTDLPGDADRQRLTLVRSA